MPNPIQGGNPQNIRELYQELQKNGVTQQEFNQLAELALEDANLSPEERLVFDNVARSGEMYQLNQLPPEVQALFNPGQAARQALTSIVEGLSPMFRQQLGGSERLEAMYRNFESLNHTQQQDFLALLNSPGIDGGQQKELLKLLGQQANPTTYFAQVDRQGQSVLANLNKLMAHPKLDSTTKTLAIQALNNPSQIPNNICHGTAEQAQNQPSEFLDILNQMQANSTASLKKSNPPADLKQALEPVLKLMEKIQPDGQTAAQRIRNMSDAQIFLSDRPLQAFLGMVEFPHEAAWSLVQEDAFSLPGSALILNDVFWTRTDGEKASALYHEYIHMTQPPGYGATGHHEEDAYRRQFSNALMGAPLFIERGNFHGAMMSNMHEDIGLDVNTDNTITTEDAARNYVKVFKDMDAADLWTNQAEYASMKNLALKMSPDQQVEVIQYMLAQNPTTSEQEGIIFAILEQATKDSPGFLSFMEKLNTGNLAAEIEDPAQVVEIAAWLAQAYQATGVSPPGKSLDDFLVSLASEHRDQAILDLLKHDTFQVNQQAFYQNIRPLTIQQMAAKLMDGDTNSSEEKAIYELLSQTGWSQFSGVMSHDPPAFLARLKSELSTEQFEAIQQRYWDIPRHSGPGRE